MVRLIRAVSRHFIVPAAWTILTVIMLVLPPSSLPENETLFKIENLDKIVHMALFGGIVLLWGAWAHPRNPLDRPWFKFLIITTLFSILLGIVMEYVQLYWVHRDFDKEDIRADAAGAILAFGYLIITRRK
jgi:hypothetical protein